MSIDTTLHRFFKELTETERRKVFHVFGVLEKDYNGAYDHGIERRLFNRMLHEIAHDVTPALQSVLPDAVGEASGPEQEHRRFTLWVKEFQIPPGRREHHWKTWQRAVYGVAQSPRTVIGPEGLQQLQYWRDGTAIIEKCLAKAVAADPMDVPFPLTGAAASLWHSASASAYQHALEMMGVPRIEPAKKVPT